MDSASVNSDGSGKQPASSILNVFSSFFNQGRAASSDLESAVLTSFKELPDGENPLPESCVTTNSESTQEKEDDHQDMACKKSGDQAETVKGAAVDPDLVQVTRVETYSDTENEGEDETHHSSSLSKCLARAMKPTRPEDGTEKKGHDNGDVPKSAAEAEYQLPVFRTHQLKDRSLIESILFSEKSKRRSDSRKEVVPSISKDGDDSRPKEADSTVCADVETPSATTNSSSSSVGAEESKGVDCSPPVPSVISGHAAGENDATVKDREDLDRMQKENAVGETGDSKVSSSVPSLPEVSDQSACGQDEQSDASGSTNQTVSSAPELSSSDSQRSSSPTSQQAAAPKTPETNSPPSTSSTGPSPASSSSSPSQSTAFSSPPSFQMPALFSGLRVLKKGVTGEDRDTTSEIKQREKDADLALLSLKKSVNKAKLFPEQKAATPVKKHAEPKPVADGKSSAVGQLSPLLSPDNKNGAKNPTEGQDGDAESKKENGEKVVEEKTPTSETPTCTPERKKTSDLAYETFRNLFGPKSVKKDKTEDVDLEAVKKKIKNDKENLRSIFERVSKSPTKESKSPIEPNVCNHIIFIRL